MRVVDELSDRKADLINEIIQNQIPKRSRQEFLVEIRLHGHRDFGSVSDVRPFAWQDRDGKPNEIQGVPRRVCRVIPFADAPQLVKMIQIHRLLFQIDRRLDR